MITRGFKFKNRNKVNGIQTKYYTTQNVNVTQRIRDGKTQLFTGDKAKDEAEAHAKEKGSYVYECLKELRESGKWVKVFVGYAVPN